ncbi:MAG: tetratricopeptide repeat-containing sensor histidine kinase [Candidatus Cloacimonadota bacterium]
MKRAFSEPEFKHSIQIADDLMKVERQEALKLFAELNKYYEEVDFSQHPEQEIQTLTGLARFRIEERELQIAEDLMQRALQIATANKLPNEKIRAKSALAVVYSLRGEQISAITVWEDLIDSITEEHYMWNTIVSNLIVAYGYTKQFYHAIDLSYKLLEFYDAHENPEGRLIALINLGNAYRPLSDADKAEKCYREAIVLATEQKNYHYLSYALSNLSMNLSDQKRHEEALGMAEQALELHKNYFSEAHAASSYANMGSILLKAGRNEEAAEKLKESLAIFVNYDDVAELIGVYQNLGHAYLRLNLPEEALPYLLKGKELSASKDYQQSHLKACQVLGEYYESIGDYASMAKEYKTLSEIQNELYEEVTTNMISKQESEYLRKKIELQNENLKTKNQELEESNILVKQQSEELQKSNSELQNSLDTLNKLISLLSHDVRGPAASVSSALRMMLDEEFDEDLKKVLMEDMIRSMDSMTDLLTEILLWIQSRRYSSGLEDMMRETELLPLINGALELYKSQANRKKITVESGIDTLLISAYTEPITLKTVLRNLISNAIKFTPQNGMIKLSSSQTDTHAVITIEDNGVGMDQEKIDLLLRQELRSSPGTNQEEGSGMGLRLSLGYLKLLHADLKVKSQPGIGTVFTINLPLKAPAL